MFRPLLWSLVASCTFMIAVTVIAQSRYQTYFALTSLEANSSAQVCSDFMCVNGLVLDGNRITKIDKDLDVASQHPRSRDNIHKPSMSAETI